MKRKNKEDIAHIMSASPLLQGLSTAECQAVYEEVNPAVETYGRQETIISEGEEECDIGIICSGVVRGEKLHMEGSIHLVDIYEKQDILSLENVVSTTRISPMSLVTMTDVEILAINGDRLMNCSHGLQIMNNIIKILADENIRRLYKIDILSHNGIRDRIMTYLQIMSQKHHGKSFHTMMNQEQMAQFLSVNRSALSNELNKMRYEGIIDFNKDKFVLIK